MNMGVDKVVKLDGFWMVTDSEMYTKSRHLCMFLLLESVTPQRVQVVMSKQISGPYSYEFI